MISSLVIHLDLDERLANEAVVKIAAQPHIEVGDRQGARLPIVLECATPSESQAISDWLIDLPGVAHLDVAFVHLDPTDEHGQQGHSLEGQAT